MYFHLQANCRTPELSIFSLFFPSDCTRPVLLPRSSRTILIGYALATLALVAIFSPAARALENNPSSPPIPWSLDVGDGPAISLPTRNDAPVKIDGKLDEEAWQGIDAITNFVSVDPDTLEQGIHATRVYMFYTSKGFYLGAEMEQDPDTLLERLTSRDKGRLNRDYLAFTLDTSGEARYGFWFQVSLGDSATDGTILPEAQYSTSWDGAWQRASRRTEKGWNAEFFIPWSILTMPKNEATRSIGVLVSRRVAYLNERWSWPALPFTESKFFSRFQKLEVENVSPRQQWAAFPYASTTLDQVDDRVAYKAGAELFWRPSTNFQATATLNPDFGNVESDDVIVNFTANEVFFRERRLFFLEGQEIFNTTPRSDASRNFNPITLVNTRRIGGRALAPDIPDDVSLNTAESSQPTELLGAIKTTGQIGQLRYGVLGAFEDDIKFDGTGDNGGDINLHQSGRDYGVVRALFEPDTDGAYIGAGLLSSSVLHPDREAYVHSVDLHYYTPDRAWSTDAQFLLSDIKSRDAAAGSEFESNTGAGGFVDVVWVPRKGLQHNLQLEYLGEQLNINDLGFQRRANTYGSRYSFSHTKSDIPWLQSLRTSGFVGAGWNTNNRLILAGTNVRQDYIFKSLNRAQVRVGYSPTRFEDRNSFGNGTYRIRTRWDARFEFATNNTKRLAMKASTRLQQGDIGGWLRGYETGLTWRMSNRMTSELSVRHTKRDAWLLHTGDSTFATFRAKGWAPRFTLDYFPTARQQFRIAFQWVAIDAKEREFFSVPDQPGRLTPRMKGIAEDSDSFTVSRVNLQVRYRWEIAPLSDLFLVYTRASQLDSSPDSDFGELFSDSFNSPFVEQLVLKLRYRLGSR